MSHRYVKKTGFVEKKMGDELILVPLSSEVAQMSEVITLNAVAAFIFDNMKQPVSIQSLVDLVVGEYEVEVVLANHDVAAFVKMALDKGIIEQVN
jgi:predicted RNA-binding protein (virulence factor B family)